MLDPLILNFDLYLQVTWKALQKRKETIGTLESRETSIPPIPIIKGFPRSRKQGTFQIK